MLAAGECGLHGAPVGGGDGLMRSGHISVVELTGPAGLRKKLRVCSRRERHPGMVTKFIIL